MTKLEKKVDKAVMDAEAVQLQALFEQALVDPDGERLSRRAFCIRNKLNETMVQQHLSSNRPISLEYARKYSHVFNVQIKEFSQRIHEHLAGTASYLTEQSINPLIAAESNDKIATPDLVAIIESHWPIKGCTWSEYKNLPAEKKEAVEAVISTFFTRERKRKA